jgi:hypothetical protein
VCLVSTTYYLAFAFVDLCSLPIFAPLTMKFSRIELLRGNAEEAIRLNVREIEALQVLIYGLESERTASSDHYFRLPIFNRRIRELRQQTTGWKGCSRSTAFTGAVQVSTLSNLGSKRFLKTIFSMKQRVWFADTHFNNFAILNLQGCKSYFLLPYFQKTHSELISCSTHLLHETQESYCDFERKISACHRLLIHIDVSEELGTSRKRASM